MSRIIEVRSGGQSGADRGAMDAARHCGVRVSGWCPAGGWAEDYPDPPGVLALYPEMVETPSSDVIQRTEWNIRDSTCCIVFNTHASDTSPGTSAGYQFNEKYGIPHLDIWLDGPGSIDSKSSALATGCARLTTTQSCWASAAPARANTRESTRFLTLRLSRFLPSCDSTQVRKTPRRKTDACSRRLAPR